MKAEELRIGNWVYIGELVGRVNDKSFLTPELFEPIPLTPEILEKAGFVKTSDIYRLKMYRWAGGLYIEVGFFGETGKGYPYFSLGNYDNSFIKNLHQLQNICYCLTGKELEIKL